MRRIRLWCILSILSVPFTAEATHIVGGEMGYKCLGNNTYEVTLRVFRDCYYGSQQAPFDDPASIGIFDHTGKLIKSVFVSRIGDDTLTNTIDPCIINSKNVCVHTTTYRTIVTLEPNDQGYRFVYQRCCRNETVRNVVKPLETGATFEIYLTGAAMARCNNSPVFRSWPPVFICRDEPFVFNHSSYDEDGDSLVYRLITPIQGGSFRVPQPIPPDGPPYEPVVWNNPPGQVIYSVENMMGFGKPLVIHPVTGRMEVTPGALGQYVIGVSVLEYDRVTKALLSETKRDFQYNVIDCARVTAAIFAPSVQCDNLTVIFDNQSRNGLVSNAFEWTFKGRGLNAASSEKNPVFTFPDTGRYVATLIAEPGTLCADTTSHEIYLQANSLRVDFRSDVIDCFGSTFITLRDRSVDLVSPVVQWFWELRLNNGRIFTSSAQSPVFEVPTGSTGTIRLTATSKNGCVQTQEKAITTGLNKPSGYITSTRIEACIGQRIGLNPETPASTPYRYRWASTSDLTDTAAVNPSVVVTGNAVYTVTVTPINGLCDTVIQVEVAAVAQTPAAFNAVLQCDGLGVAFTNTTPGNSAGRWVIERGTGQLLDTLASSFVYPFPGPGEYPVTLITVNECPDTLTKTIQVLGDFIEPAFTYALTGCSDSENRVRFTDTSKNLFGDTNFREWVLSDGQRSSSSTPEFIFKDGVDSVTVQFTIGGAKGCKETLTRRIHVRFTDFSKVGPPVNVLLVCADIPTRLNPNGSTSYRYQWTPSTGLSASNVPNPSVRALKDTRYEVRISDSTGVCDTLVSLWVKVANFRSQTPPDTIVVCPDVPTPLHPRGDSLYRFSWSPAIGLSATDVPNPIVTTKVSQTYRLRISDPLYQCDTVVTVVVKVADFVGVGPSSELLVCANTPTPLNPNGSSLYLYSWSPATGLSSTTAPNPVVTTNSGGTYFVRIVDPKDNCGTLLSVTLNLVNFRPVSPSSRVLVCPGIPTPLNPNGNSAYRYAWSPATGLSSANTPNPSVFTSVNRTYQVRITDPLGKCDTTVNVQVNTTNFASVAPPAGLIACPGQPTPLNPKGDSLYRYEWVPATGLSAANVPNPLFNGSNATTYRVRISDPLGNCDTTVSIKVDIARFGAVSPDANQLLCPGVPTSLNPMGNPLYRYSWSPAIGLSDANAPNPVATLSQPATYQVRISDPNNFCDTSISVNIQIVRFASVGPDTGQTLCPGIATPLNPRGNPAYRYAWSPATGLSAADIPNPIATLTADATYTLKITAPSGLCDTTLTIRVKMDAPIRLDAGKDTTQCVAGPLVLKASTSGVPADLQWSNRPGFGVVLGVEPMLTITPARGSQTFYLRATSKRGCVETDSVVVRSLPLLAALQPKAVACISGTLINLSVSNRDTSQRLRYLWSPANLIISDPVNGPDAIVKAQDNTVIQVALSNQFGCTDTLRTNVVVPDLPSRLSIQADKNPIRKGEQSVITVNGCTQCTFSWSPTTGLNTSSGPSVIASPEETTIYSVKVTQEGCEHTLSIRIEVKQCVEPFLPNAFTPNGDGINDVLYARLKDYEAMQLIIYNRWGQEVFDTRNPDVGWDGTFRGRQLPPDVYGFYLYMICPDGTEYKKRGSISLIR